MKKVFFFLQLVALFLLLKPCSDLCVGGVADQEGERCKVLALFWWW